MPKEYSRKIWITWENQRRNHSLSKALGAKLFQFDTQFKGVVRYLVALFKTAMILSKEKTDLIFVQNPSIVLATFATIYGRIQNTPVVVDAHNAGIYPFNGQRRWANMWARILFRLAQITIVTNVSLADYVDACGGRSIVMPDPIPDLSNHLSKLNLKGQNNIVFICTWADDEPYEEVIRAAELLEKKVVIYITGNSKGKGRKQALHMPENVVLTGYLPEDEFISLLNSSDVIMDLTTREDCLVCGAYEAVSLGKPLIVSDTKALRDYFSKGAVYSNNTANKIAEAIQEAITKKEKLEHDIMRLRQEKVLEWTTYKEKLEDILIQINLSKRSV